MRELGWNRSGIIVTVLALAIALTGCGGGGGGDAAVAEAADQADIAGALDMGAAAQLDRPAQRVA